MPKNPTGSFGFLQVFCRRGWKTFALPLLGALLALLPCWAEVSAESPAGDQATVTLASSRIPADHSQQYSDLAVDWMRQYLRIDTTNPPGNEMRAVTFLKGILDREGIENRVFEYAPGRGDLWARLPHIASGTAAEPKRPIILLNHMDVVTSDASHWQVPPFSGEIKNGYVWGRGAQDMKDEGMAQLVAMVMLKREHVRLDRDVIFLAVADEEMNGSGSDWFIEHQRELLGNAEFLINEGGENLLVNERVKYVGVDVGEKTVYWLHVVAHGRAGHASRPIPDSAPNRLVRALDRIIAYQTPLRVLPVVQEFLLGMAPYEPAERAREFRNIQTAIEDKTFQEEVSNDESLNYLLRDTISLTMMGASEQTNVIPAEAWANLDVRILPGGDRQALLEAIRKVGGRPERHCRAAQLGVSRGKLFADGYRFVRRDSSGFRAILSGDARGAAHHQRLHREPALPAAGHRRLRVQSLRGHG